MGYLRKDHVIGALEDDKTGTMVCYERERDRDLIKHCYESMEYVIDGLPQYRANNVYEDAKDTNVPSKWIPCSERLPKNAMNVIAQFSSGAVTELRYAGNGIFEGIYEYSTKVIIAWMPLPEPYKEVEEYEKNV